MKYLIILVLAIGINPTLALENAYQDGNGSNDQFENSKKYKEENEIVVTRIKTSSGYDGLNITFQVNSSIENFVHVLNDVDHYTNWAYKCLEAGIISSKSPGNFQYYSVVDFPWPMSDRIIAADCHQHMNEQGVYFSQSKGITDKIDQRGLVPLPYFESQWVITPLSTGLTGVDYTIVSDPIHSLPAFLYNLAVSKGPTETIGAIIQQSENYHTMISQESTLIWK